MTLSLPKQDNRRFQDIVDEAKKRINYHCPEWTDHNVSDPGVTMIELFAWMTDILLYQVNQMPRRHYVEMLNLLGVKLAEPVAARVPVTFWLSKAADRPCLIEASTEISTTQTETRPPIIFITDKQLEIQPPQLAAIQAWQADEDNSREFYQTFDLSKITDGYEPESDDEKWPAVFSATPRQGEDALYFGFENDLSHHLLHFKFKFIKAAGAGAKSRHERRPYVWEAYTGNTADKKAGWDEADVEADTTEVMNRGGESEVRLHLPDKIRKTILPHDADQKECYWVRVRVKELTPADIAAGVSPFTQSPRLGQIGVSVWGGTVEATHCQKIEEEFLGRSDGEPGQRFSLQNTPILKRQPDEHLIVKVEGQPDQEWQEKADFSGSKPSDPCYTLDSATGELRLGPAVRVQDGTIKHYGAIPPRGATLVFKKYRYGGNIANVGPGEVDILKTSIPYVDSVKNRKGPVRKGLDAETLEEAMLRAPGLLRSRDRAVTEEDFEFLARQALPEAIGRVKSLSSETGRVTVLVIPRVLQPERRPLSEDELRLSENDERKLKTYLKKRCLLTTQLEIRYPDYIQVSVEVTLRVPTDANRDEVKEEVLARLYQFLNPLVGGMREKGWPFGHGLSTPEVYQCLGGLPDVERIQAIKIFEKRPKDDAKRQVGTVDVTLAQEMIISGQHQIKFLD